MIRNKKLRLDKIFNWDDEFEIFILRDIENKKILGTSEQCKKIFGQSWTLREESEAMWHAYSHKEFIPFIEEEIFLGVKLRTTIEKLFNVFTSNPFIMERYIGEVCYLTEEKFKSTRLEFINKFRSENWGFREMKEAVLEELFIKRQEFESEQEIRIVNIAGTEDDNYDFEEYDIENINDFIEEICLDSRLDKNGGSKQFDFLKKLLVETGINEKKIKKSQIYTYKPID